LEGKNLQLLRNRSLSDPFGPKDNELTLPLPGVNVEGVKTPKKNAQASRRKEAKQIIEKLDPEQVKRLLFTLIDKHDIVCSSIS
jgi:hypothetical protein